MSGISSVEDFALSLKLNLKQLQAMESLISTEISTLKSLIQEKRDEKNLAYNTGTQLKFATSQEEEVVWT